MLFLYVTPTNLHNGTNGIEVAWQLCNKRGKARKARNFALKSENNTDAQICTSSLFKMLEELSEDAKHTKMVIGFQLYDTLHALHKMYQRAHLQNPVATLHPVNVPLYPNMAHEWNTNSAANQVDRVRKYYLEWWDRETIATDVLPLLTVSTTDRGRMW